jgi:hypothetical protein
VCTFPWGVRAVLGYDKQLCARAVSAFVSELSRSLRRRAKKLLGLASVTQTHTGAVAAIQRTHSALRLNVHYRDERQDFAGERGRAIDAGAAVDLLRVVFQRVLADAQVRGYLLVLFAFNQPHLNFCLALRQAETRLHEPTGGGPCVVTKRSCTTTREPGSLIADMQTMLSSSSLSSARNFPRYQHRARLAVKRVAEDRARERSAASTTPALGSRRHWMPAPALSA